MATAAIEGTAAMRNAEAEGRRESAAHLLGYVCSEVKKKLQEDKEALPKELHQEEWDKIAHQGSILCQTFTDEVLKSGQTACYDRVVDKRERRHPH